jgi:hypothetical protein
MGNVIELLKRSMFDRRKNENIDSRSRPDHPERLPTDNLSIVKDTEQNSKLLSSSSSSPTTDVVTATITTTAEMTSVATSTETKAESNICSEFYLACRGNNVEEVEKLLKTITIEEIDRLEPNGSTALHAACYHGHEEIVKLLLVAGADRSIHNKHNYLPFDEAANDEIKSLFLRVPNNNRLLSSTGAIEWELIDDDVLEKAEEDREAIQFLYDKAAKATSLHKMFEKIEKNYINKVLTNFDGIQNIKLFFHKATEEQDPTWIIKAYTAETDFYKVLNTEIACGATHGQSERKYLIALLCHHPKLDQLTYIGHSYRVIKINIDDVQKYHVGCSLMAKTFLSTSIDEKTAAWFLCQQEATLTLNNDRQRCKLDGTLIKSWIMCKYKIKHRRTALNIENISQYTNEGEILIMPYTVFKVNKIEKVKPSYLLDGQTITEIILEEHHTSD